MITPPAPHFIRIIITVFPLNYFQDICFQKSHELLLNRRWCNILCILFQSSTFRTWELEEKLSNYTNYLQTKTSLALLNSFFARLFERITYLLSLAQEADWWKLCVAITMLICASQHPDLQRPKQKSAHLHTSMVHLDEGFRHTTQYREL